LQISIILGNFEFVVFQEQNLGKKWSYLCLVNVVWQIVFAWPEI